MGDVNEENIAPDSVVSVFPFRGNAYVGLDGVFNVRVG